jgi:hypothetical protein
MRHLAGSSRGAYHPSGQAGVSVVLLTQYYCITILLFYVYNIYIFMHGCHWAAEHIGCDRYSDLGMETVGPLQDHGGRYAAQLCDTHQQAPSTKRKLSLRFGVLERQQPPPGRRRSRKRCQSRNRCHSQNAKTPAKRAQTQTEEPLLDALERCSFHF